MKEFLQGRDSTNKGNYLLDRDLKFIHFNRESIFEYLLTRNEPVMESSLIKQMGLDSMDGGLRENLYSIHFSLFHVLYSLRMEKGLEGFFCHIDPMRIRILPMPGNGFCSHYNPENGTFCLRKTHGLPFCDFHIREYNRIRKNLLWDPLSEFYINPENISFGRSALLEKLMNGISVYAFRKGEVERALEFFGIEYPGRDIIKRKYRELALEYHPDKNSGDESRMKDLNHYYSVLTEVFPA